MQIPNIIRNFQTKFRVDAAIWYDADSVIDSKAAIEVKTAKSITNKELKGLMAFMDENAVRNYIIVCRELFERTTDDGIRIMPWKAFLDRLWNGEIIQQSQTR